MGFSEEELRKWTNKGGKKLAGEQKSLINF
jgi:hypothetical protein